jgi:uncharacterized protein (DUF4213/DUF364 family)
MVGVVGDVILRLAAETQFEVSAFDYAPDLVGSRVHGVAVQNGRRTLAGVRAADVALVTGMTLWNGSLDRILGTARRAGTKLVLFAETGAHFAEEYCRMGVDCVVSEPFPFYLVCGGPSTLNVHRRHSTRSSNDCKPR